MTDWETVWARRTLPPTGSTLERLMAADGLDTGFSGLSEPDWRRGVEGIATAIGLRAGESVFDVGCGAGAFLYPLVEDGHPVGGIDRSPSLVDFAREALPTGRFTVSDADALDDEPSDVVVSMGVFMYFPDLPYAERVLDRMVAKARRVVAILDVPDAAGAEEARQAREALAGGPAAYARRYAGLDHRSYARAWADDALRSRGLKHVTVADQIVPGYGNTPFRFNAWGTK